MWSLPEVQSDGCLTKLNQIQVPTKCGLQSRKHLPNVPTWTFKFSSIYLPPDSGLSFKCLTLLVSDPISVLCLK